ncbi:SAM-dependent methyltransferase [Rhodococcus sp. SRB_17]|nr:SAM-dependent methyltransferase [Rhodococcus sp. SRB_17]
MSRMPDDYFTQMYAQNPDPWGFDERWYEHRKRNLTAAILPRARFRHAFEPGCSIGNLTTVLAPRCDSLLATDIVDSALVSARSRLERTPHPDVTFIHWALGDPWPDATFDLIVLSEVCYYLEPHALLSALDEAAAHLTTDGVLLAAHWRHPVSDYPMTGDEVHNILSQHQALTRTARYEDPDLLLETFAPVGTKPKSVATIEGLVA